MATTISEAVAPTVKRLRVCATLKLRMSYDSEGCLVLATLLEQMAKRCDEFNALEAKNGK